MPRLSIIVPVYKVERYIHKCIDSILNQTFTDFELILVDDGSPDSCGKICDEYAAKDARVKVIHKENGGQSSARNMGLDVAEGEYIGFVDSDDDILPDMFQSMVEYGDREDLDIVCCDAVLIRGSRIKHQSMYPDNKIFEGKDGLVENLTCRIDNAVWDKIYRKRIFEKIRFTEGIVFEDVRIMYLLFNEAERVGYIKKGLYNYYKRENSTIAQSFNSKSRYECFVGYKKRMLFAEEHDLPCVEECRKLAISTALSALTAFYANDETENDCRVKEVKSFIASNQDMPMKELKTKDKVLLWSFNDAEIIHKIYAFSSKIRKII